jgi:glycosyltransferase involved in cell wall biosynthesis
LVVEYNGSEVWIAKNWARSLRHRELAALAEDALLRHAHLVVTVSDVLRDDLEARGVPAERIAWYPNCVDPEVFSPDRFSSADRARIRASYGIAPSSVVVGFIGTFGPWHGSEVLARAIRLIAEEHAGWLERRRPHFLLVGDGARLPEVRRILGRLVGEIVTITGLVPQEAAALHLSAADILVSPHVANEDGTRFFGSPTKLFEYMASGRAILASELDQIGTVLRPALDVRHLPSGPPEPGSPFVAVLSRPGSPEELVDGIRFLVDQPEWRSALAANARSLVLSKYTWRHHVDAVLDGLSAVVGG